MEINAKFNAAYIFSYFQCIELAGRIPKAGSAYVYTYVSIGEFLAFSIGWNLVLEYIIGLLFFFFLNFRFLFSFFFGVYK